MSVNKTECAHCCRNVHVRNSGVGVGVGVGGDGIVAGRFKTRKSCNARGVLIGTIDSVHPPPRPPPPPCVQWRDPGQEAQQQHHRYHQRRISSATAVSGRPQTLHGEQQQQHNNNNINNGIFNKKRIEIIGRLFSFSFFFRSASQ